MINESLLEYVARINTLIQTDADGKIPLFGDGTPILELMMRKSFEPHLITMQEHYAQILKDVPKEMLELAMAVVPRIYLDTLLLAAAFASGITPDDGILIEVGCGIAVPSIVYNLLTGRFAVGVDVDSEEIDRARYLSEVTGAKIQLLNQPAQEILLDFQPRHIDLVMATGATGEIRALVINNLMNSGANFVIDGLPSDIKHITEVLRGKNYKFGTIESEGTKITPDKILYGVNSHSPFYKI